MIWHYLPSIFLESLYWIYLIIILLVYLMPGDLIFTFWILGLKPGHGYVEIVLHNGEVGSDQDKRYCYRQRTFTSRGWVLWVQILINPLASCKTWDMWPLFCLCIHPAWVLKTILATLNGYLLNPLRKKAGGQHSPVWGPGLDPRATEQSS